jgi:hypothetical protein
MSEGEVQGCVGARRCAADPKPIATAGGDGEENEKNSPPGTCGNMRRGHPFFRGAARLWRKAGRQVWR